MYKPLVLKFGYGEYGVGAGYNKNEELNVFIIHKLDEPAPLNTRVCEDVKFTDLDLVALFEFHDSKAVDSFLHGLEKIKSKLIEKEQLNNG